MSLEIWKMVKYGSRAEEIVKFRRVVGSDWLEYIYNV